MGGGGRVGGMVGHRGLEGIFGCSSKTSVVLFGSYSRDKTNMKHQTWQQKKNNTNKNNKIVFGVQIRGRRVFSGDDAY